LALPRDSSRQFRISGREPFGQEKIDAAAQSQSTGGGGATTSFPPSLDIPWRDRWGSRRKSKAEQDQAINAAVKKHDAEVKKWIEQYKGEIYVK
jgi:hypothetical protein